MLSDLQKYIYLDCLGAWPLSGTEPQDRSRSKQSEARMCYSASYCLAFIKSEGLF